MSRYQFYDLETSGLNPAFNQILQFAVVETDANFKEISRDNIRIRLSQDQIPHPQALWVNHTHPNHFQTGLSEYEGMKKIHAIMNKPNVINLGFNTLKFDEEFLRFSFFRNLFAPYTHQWANGCSRLDIYPIILLAYRFRPGLLKWPVVNEKVSFKLEHLVRENGISSGHSHDALVDVLDTIALAKILKSDTEFWQKAVSYFDKKKDESRILNCPSKWDIGDFSAAYGFFLEAKPHVSFVPVIELGFHQVYENQTRCLRLDNISFRDFPLNELPTKMEVLRKKMGEPPFFFHRDELITLNEPKNHTQEELVKNNLNFLSEHPHFFKALRNDVLKRVYVDRDDCDSNAMLYIKGFSSYYEATVFQQFHLIERERKVEISASLIHPVYRDLVLRLLGREMWDLLSSEKKMQYAQYLRKVFTATPDNALQDHKGQRKLTLTEALTETERLLEEKKDPADQDFLLALQSWYLAKQKAYAPIMSTNNVTHMSFFSSASQSVAERAASLGRESGQRRDR